jgi:D-beta-D-heptose 7-phosphate kinase/D-beta-D-heptose 1-phosphate adenosyltransferase
MALRDLVERFAGLAIFVAGDPMTDVYHFGHVDRLSPEAPVPVFVQDSVSRRSGGAANVVANLRALNIDTRNTFPSYEIWSEKHRYMVGHQQLLRVDQDVNIAADWSGAGNLKDWDALVISDYRKGAFIGPNLSLQIEAFSEAGVPIIVDPKARTTSSSKRSSATTTAARIRRRSGTLSRSAGPTGSACTARTARSWPSRRPPGTCSM